MRIEQATRDVAKGWYLGNWNSDLDIAIGYANAGVDEPHFHQQITEIYLVARGTAEMRIEQETVKLRENDVIVIEPGEAHTFLSCSPGYFHFVLHVPTNGMEITKIDKVSVPRSRLGL